jgi:hypothetical protein
MRGFGIVGVLVFGTLIATSASAQELRIHDVPMRIQPVQAEFPIESLNSMTCDELIRLIDERIAQAEEEDPSVDPPADPPADPDQPDPVPMTSGSQFNQADVDRGEIAFSANCTDCHDANRSFEKQKSYSDWMATVRRMSAMEDADIPADDLIPIATYLASLNPSASGPSTAGANGGGGVGAAPSQTTAIFGTISPLWRGSSGQQPLESPDFFVDA